MIKTFNDLHFKRNIKLNKNEKENYDKIQDI